MDRLPQLGRYFFAVAFAVFGIHYFVYGAYPGGLSPLPPWARGGAVGAHLIGALLLVARISLVANRNARLFAALLDLLRVLLLYSQHFTKRT